MKIVLDNGLKDGFEWKGNDYYYKSEMNKRRKEKFEAYLELLKACEEVAYDNETSNNPNINYSITINNNYTTEVKKEEPRYNMFRYLH